MIQGVRKDSRFTLLKGLPMSGLSLKARLWLLSIATAFGIAVLATLSVVLTHSSETLLVRFADEGVVQRHLAMQSYANGLQKGQALRNILLNPDDKRGMENFIKATETFNKSTEQLLPMLKGASAPLLARLKDNRAQWLPLQDKIIETIRSGDLDTAQRLLVDKETPAWRLCGMICWKLANWPTRWQAQSVRLWKGN